MTSFEFNAVLLEISNELSSDQLNQMKFLCRNLIGKREQEKIDSGRRLFEILTERGSLGRDNKDYLCQLLKEIHRHDLSDKLNGFESESESTDNQPDEEKTKLDIATEVIAGNLGRRWRKLGRKLGFTDVKLDSISKRYPTELEETVMELLKEWRKNQGANARTEELIKALRACQYNMTADEVENRLAYPEFE